MDKSTIHKRLNMMFLSGALSYTKLHKKSSVQYSTSRHQNRAKIFQKVPLK